MPTNPFGKLQQQQQQQTPTLDNFITAVSSLIQARDGAKLQDFLQIEPPWPPVYNQMAAELRSVYPSTRPQSEASILSRCEVYEKIAEGWIAFPGFMKLYLMYLRDVNVGNLLETYNLLNALLNQCLIALGDSQHGVILLPTVLYLTKTLAKLAIDLDKQPALIAHLIQTDPSTTNEGAAKTSLVERSANVAREAFIKCLTDRSGNSKLPEGKRKGIYLMANLCLNLLFKCGKLRNAEQMFTSIATKSPPLSLFPASQRVTYLYYLARYLFANNLFWSAKNAFEAAYQQCHPQAISQRRQLLVYLITTNLILGRFPSQALLQRPEATDLAPRFLPLCHIIKTGNIALFRRYLADGSESGEWFAKKGVLLQLRNRCEVLVWRSLTRRVFIVEGFHGVEGAQKGPPPFLHLWKVEVAARMLEKQQRQQEGRQDFENVGKKNLIFDAPTDIDFARQVTADPQEEADEFSDYFHPEFHFTETGEMSTGAPEDHNAGTSTSMSVEQVLKVSFAQQRADEDSDQNEDDPDFAPHTTEMESIISSLLTQDLLRGYLTHKNSRFAIPGAKIRGALATGWPSVWSVVSAKEASNYHVPGWVKG